MGGLHFRLARAALAVAALMFWPGEAAPLDSSLRLGQNQLSFETQDLALDVYTYRPVDCARPSVLFVFHGNGRGATSYRNSAQPVADEACFVVYSPYLDRDRFPNWSYHRGGLMEDGALRDDDEWTVSMVEDLVSWARAREGADARVYLFGHSAGAQFLSRVAAYALPEGVEQIVLANPSTYVLPNREDDVPYGFAGLPSNLGGDASVAAYLAAPITVYLGLDDTGTKDLTRNEFADKQGANRLDRGRKVFELARQTAEANGWPFGWTLVEVPGVGHTARGMLQADEFIQALGFGSVEM